MIVVQKKGPFKNGQAIEAGKIDGMYISHFGIQLPRKRAIDFEYDTYQPDLSISNGGSSVEISVNAAGVLEVDGIHESHLTIKFKRDVPADTLLDFVYTSEEDEI